MNEFKIDNYMTNNEKHKLCKDCLIVAACDKYICNEKYLDFLNSINIELNSLTKDHKCMVCNKEVNVMLGSTSQDLLKCKYCITTYKVEKEQLGKPDIVVYIHLDNETDQIKLVYTEPPIKDKE